MLGRCYKKYIHIRIFPENKTKSYKSYNSFCFIKHIGVDFQECPIFLIHKIKYVTINNGIKGKYDFSFSMHIFISILNKRGRRRPDL